jgi:hypothetical protein
MRIRIHDTARKYVDKGGVVDRHRFNADPDPTFHFDADLDPDSTPSFQLVGKIRFFS